ncbi:MAG: tRNA modification GTPase [bacterium]|nr:MAG: tRNA modification GTPase [bacterium]
MIAALATPAGTGALAVVRLSGDDAVTVAERVFRGRGALSTAPSHQLRRGVVVHPDRPDDPIDEVLAVVMRAPRSYTGETVVEFSGHGSPEAARSIVEALIDAGARPATPGEFTRRAFLNGKIDLAQAEAVAGLVEARGRRARRNALSQLQGGLSGRVGALRRRLLDELAPLEAFIDFGDDVPEAPGLDRIIMAIDEVRAGIDRLLGGRERGRLMTHGATVALAGRPNVGKSSLLNAIAGQERALVHDAPGTTRDLVDVELSLGGYAVRLVDTAGIRVTPDPVESAGVDRARRAVHEADVALLVLEAPEPPGDDDRLVAELIDDRPMLVIRNKIDLGDDAACRDFARRVAGNKGEVLPVSARRGDGLDHLVASLAGRIKAAAGDDEGPTMTSLRHYEALFRARGALDRTAEAIAEGAFADMQAAELRESLSALAGSDGDSSMSGSTPIVSGSTPK